MCSAESSLVSVVALPSLVMIQQNTPPNLLISVIQKKSHSFIGGISNSIESFKLLKRNIPEHLNCNSQSCFDQEALRHVWCFWWTLVENPTLGQAAWAQHYTELQSACRRLQQRADCTRFYLIPNFALTLPNCWINESTLISIYCILGCLLFESAENVKIVLMVF